MMGGSNVKMCKILKKTLAVCLIGLGLGMLLVLLLPLSGWLFIIGIIVVVVGLMWLCSWIIYCWSKTTL